MGYKTVVKESKAIFKQYKTALTLRQLFYRLVSKHIMANTIAQYKQLSRILVKAREDGDMPEDCLEDRTRTTIGADGGYDNTEEFIDAHIRWFKDSWERYTMPLWETQPDRVEIWVEKDALSQICSRIAEGFNVKTCPSRGYSSYTYVKKAVDRIRGDYQDKTVTILYFGDYDPSGVDIERDLGERLHRYGAGLVKVERMALTLAQIQKYQLPPFPAKTTDPRLAKFIADTGGSDAVELDALEPDVLEKMILEAIQNHIDKGPWADRLQEISEGQAELKSKFETLKISFEGGDNTD
jgi:hypothetical protein